MRNIGHNVELSKLFLKQYTNDMLDSQKSVSYRLHIESVHAKLCINSVLFELKLHIASNYFCLGIALGSNQDPDGPVHIHSHIIAFIIHTKKL